MSEVKKCTTKNYPFIWLTYKLSIYLTCRSSELCTLIICSWSITCHHERTLILGWLQKSKDNHAHKSKRKQHSIYSRSSGNSTLVKTGISQGCGLRRIRHLEDPRTLLIDFRFWVLGLGPS
ncbi:uncharacterized protein [Musca autumnalis]|uniref:uncharacterized protein n=1 Tax=Musca autumnalis TaxID=221902 RepID=UPI003CF442E4